MANVAFKQEGRPASGRKRINRERLARQAAVLPVIKRHGQRVLTALKTIGALIAGLLWVSLIGCDGMIRLRGPGLRPEERHEFESVEAKSAARRSGWL